MTLWPGMPAGEAGRLCHHSPQYDPGCFVHYGDEQAAHPRPGVYYCFVCDTTERDYCAGCFLFEHDDHYSEQAARDSFEAGERILLRGPDGRIWAASSEVAERVRPLAYLELLERYDWDETKAPPWFTPELCVRVESLRAQLEALRECLERVDWAGEDLTTRLFRLARTPRKGAHFAERIGAALLAVQTLPKDKSQWRSAPVFSGVSEIPCSTRCDRCGELRAPYGPAPRTCTPCLQAAVR